MSNAKAVSQELFSTLQKGVAKTIKKKLRDMQIDVSSMELHNSTSTKTLRVYVTVSRTTNLKALYLAESVICKQVQEEFGMCPHAFFWRYSPARRALPEPDPVSDPVLSDPNAEPDAAPVSDADPAPLPPLLQG